MLIDFTVENFRSIREPVTLSMIEQAPRKSRQKGGVRKRPLPTDEEISPALEVSGWDFKLLRTAAVFGANASGKSNVIRALAALRQLLAHGPERGFGEQTISPFLLDAGSRDRPTRFVLRVATPGIEGAVVQAYELALADGEVVKERLTWEVYGQEQHEVFSRAPNSGTPRFADGLPAAVADSEQALGPATPLLHYLISTLRIRGLEFLEAWLSMTHCYTDATAWIASFDTHWALEADDAMRLRVGQLVAEFDTGISSFAIEPGERRGRARVMVHHGDFPDAPAWPLSEESAGTRRLFELSVPILRALDSGGLVVLDEFGAHLHPHVTRRIVERFQRADTNPKGAQLVFNSQDVSLLANRLLRRDQIWYTTKAAAGNTELYPLSDFKVRNDLAIDSAYLDGRFGAVPFLPAGGRA